MLFDKLTQKDYEGYYVHRFECKPEFLKKNKLYLI